jgi:hypothetical protein
MIHLNGIQLDNPRSNGDWLADDILLILNWYAILLLTLRAMAMSAAIAKSLNYYGWFIAIPTSWIMNISNIQRHRNRKGKMCIKDCFQRYPRTNHPTTIIIMFPMFLLKLPWMTQKKNKHYIRVSHLRWFPSPTSTQCGDRLVLYSALQTIWVYSNI